MANHPFTKAIIFSAKKLFVDLGLWTHNFRISVWKMERKRDYSFCSLYVSHRPLVWERGAYSCCCYSPLSRPLMVPPEHVMYIFRILNSGLCAKGVNFQLNIFEYFSLIPSLVFSVCRGRRARRPWPSAVEAASLKRRLWRPPTRWPPPLRSSTKSSRNASQTR